MGTHLSIRLPWHDRGWDGHVCDKPVANVYCSGEYGLKAHGIRDKKEDGEEALINGRPVELLRECAYHPPCMRTIQTFGGRKPLDFMNEPKEFLNTDKVRIAPIPEQIPCYSSGTWPYDRVFRREKDAPEDTQDVFLERYDPREAATNIKEVFGQIKYGKSLAFYYLNYDNPLNSERRKYVLVGAAEIDKVSPQLEWEQIDPEKDQIYGRMIWNRYITSGYGDGRGARIPYDQYLKAGIDTSDILIEISEDMAQHFKYVCRSFSDDEAAMLLRELLAALERGRDAGAVGWDWERQIGWINTAIDRVLKDRGTFPGMGAVLEALSFKNAILYVDHYITAKGVKDVRSHVLERVANPAKAETPEAQKSYEKVANMLRVLPGTVRNLLFDRLCLFELTRDQVRLIVGNGLVADDDRISSGIVSSAEAIAENPYLIVEEYDPINRDERIPFYRIDQGIYLPMVTGGLVVPGLDNFDKDDKRRIRACAVTILREEQGNGHTFLPQDDLLAAISRKRLHGMPDSIGAVLLARDLSFYEEMLALVDGNDFKGWMLKVIADDEDVIRLRIQKLHGRKPNTVRVRDWAKHLPNDSILPPEIQKEAVRTQQEVLERLSTQPFSVLTGSAGTGKTTVIAALIKGLRESDPTEKFLLIAPTGKATVRLKRKINEIAGIDLEPLTIHGYLMRHSWMQGETFRCLREGNPVESDVSTVIIDECSMLETPIFATIIRSIDWTSQRLKRLILAGDPQQLPPIGTGAPFKNIVDHLASLDAAAQQPCVLTVNCRQIQENSSALRLAEQFTTKADRVTADELFQKMAGGGRIGIDLEVRFFKDETDLPDCVAKLVEDALNELLHLYGSKQCFDPERPWEAYDALHGFGEETGKWRLDAFEILSPYRGGYFGSDPLNQRLQDLLRRKLLNRNTPKLGRLGGRQFIWADKVLQVRNKRIKAKSEIAWNSENRQNTDFYLANGELGRMMKVGKSGKEKVGWARFETDPRIVISIDERWAEEAMDLGYAMSVHKSQGSDFGGVILVIPKEERVQLVTRELLYTALTRFTRRLYLLVQGQPGDLDALQIGLWRGASCFLRRHTCLYTAQRAIADIENWRPENRIIRTLRDEMVASKSEAIISTLLSKAKVHYFYEKILIANDGSMRRPDFTIPLETPDGPTELYWEHWGKLGDPSYEESVVRRREWYKRNGLADRLVESDELGGFDVKKIQNLINERILT